MNSWELSEVCIKQAGVKVMEAKEKQLRRLVKARVKLYFQTVKGMGHRTESFPSDEQDIHEIL